MTFVRTFILISFLGIASGCSCGKTAHDKAGPPSPLVARSLPADLKDGVHLAEGVTSETLVAVVLSASEDECSRVERALRKRAHVVCTTGVAQAGEEYLRKALAFLKKEYSGYVAPPPVWLFSDSSRAEMSFRLMLAEPSFFSYAYIPGLSDKFLTATVLSGLHERGARELVLTNTPSKRVEMLVEVTARRGLNLHFLPSAPADPSAIVDLLAQADQRFEPASKPGSN